MIEIIGTSLNQWDVGRSVKVTKTDADHCHFSNKGDLKAVIMEIADELAKIPDYLLQTGKQLCVYAVKDGITVESNTFFVRKRERPENYVYEEDQRNYIYELITNAETATAAANQAAEFAMPAAENANAASVNANNAAASASEAANHANEAATKAANTAKSLMVVGKAKGENIYLDDAIEQYLVGLRIFGKTVHDGVPTSEAPVDLVSVENATVAINEQSVLVPYTLHGMPVTTGGNYTDASGQQWLCDEIDLVRGVYVQRVGKYEYTGEESWVKSTAQNQALIDAGMVRYDARVPQYPKAGAVAVLSSHCLFAGLNSYDKTSGMGVWVSADSSYLEVRIVVDMDTVDELKTWLAEQYSSGTPVTVLYVLATPIVTPLSPEELAAYASLHTTRGNNTVSNDASAHMEIEYVMDAKKYIDSLISTSILEATVE